MNGIYEKCPTCGSTDKHCYLLGNKGWYPRKLGWHKGRKLFSHRNVACPYCGADVGQPCCASNDVPLGDEHSDRKRANMDAINKRFSHYDELCFGGSR